MTPTASVIGAGGEMGRHLLLPLLEKKTSVIAADKDADADALAAAWDADVVVLAVPQAAARGLLEGRRLRPGQLVVDIFSQKKDTRALVTATGAAHLSLHPMNGPHTPWSRQKWLIVGPQPETESARWVLDLLREKRVMLREIATDDLHDLLMSAVLGLPEAWTLVFQRFCYDLARDRPELDLKTLLQGSSPAFSLIFAGHAHAATSSAQWLREVLLTDLHPSFAERCARVFAGLSDTSALADGAALVRQRTSLDALETPELVPALRRISTDAFDTFNGMFAGGRTVGKDALYVQKPCDAATLLDGKERIRVGIHGIRGSFTDQAWHRFAAEVAGLPEDRCDVLELVHSSNVLDAVERDEADVGIFAFANSGSGGYLASIEAMGRHRYALQALFTMPIDMCILGHPSVRSVHGLDAFFGHPVALSQCRQTLEQRWPDIPVEAATDEMDTALSAKLLAEGKIDPRKGVFASARAADIYGLTVLAESVHHDPNNATAFAVVRAER